MQLNYQDQVRYKNLTNTFYKYAVESDFVEPLFNYLVYGFKPGGFLEACLANDLNRAINNAHHLVQKDHIKYILLWINNAAPYWSHGDYTSIDNWCRLTNEERTATLAKLNYALSDEEVTWAIMKEGAR